MEPAEMLAPEVQATTIAVRLPRCLDGVNEARVVSRHAGGCASRVACVEGFFLLYSSATRIYFTTLFQIRHSKGATRIYMENPRFIGLSPLPRSARLFYPLLAFSSLTSSVAS